MELGVVVLLAVVLLGYISISGQANKRSKSGHVPFVNTAKGYNRLGRALQTDFIKSSRSILAQAKALYHNKICQIVTDSGPVLYLPASFAHELRNHPNLSFSKAIREDNHAHIPGFDTVNIISRDDQLLQNVVRRQLTKHLTSVIQPLSEETEYAVRVALGESTEWQQVHLKTAVMDIIARMSSRIYLGTEMCRNEEWLAATREYTAAFFDSCVELRMFPASLRPLAHWFLSPCRCLRTSLRKAQDIISPLIERRKAERNAALTAGKRPVDHHDSLDWAEEVATSAYDPAHFQLTLGLLAIHTTFDLLQQVMLDLAKHPEFTQPLRDEISTVLSQHGWNKSAFHHMPLLDSCIKESQRLKPGSLTSMRRKVTSDIVLSHGLLLPKGSRICVDNSRMMDPSFHVDPERYDAYRFLRLREQTGYAFKAQLVTTSPDHLAFGYGNHSCPGRFFAAAEIKVALCHLLIKYEWRLVEGSSTEPIVRGMVAKSSPTVRVWVRRRGREDMEIDLEGL